MSEQPADGGTAPHARPAGEERTPDAREETNSGPSIAEQVAERVYALFCRDLRVERERRGR